MTGKRRSFSIAVASSEYEYTILLEHDDDDGGFMVTVPALPGVVTQGETVEECLERAREAIGLRIEGLLASGMEVPRNASNPSSRP